MRTVNTVQGDDGGLSGKLPMTPQMQVGVQVFECVCLCVFIFVCLFFVLQAAKMTSLDVFGFDPDAPDSDDEPITDVED